MIILLLLHALLFSPTQVMRFWGRPSELTFCTWGLNRCCRLLVALLDWNSTPDLTQHRGELGVDAMETGCPKLTWIVWEGEEEREEVYFCCTRVRLRIPDRSFRNFGASRRFWTAKKFANLLVFRLGNFEKVSRVLHPCSLSQNFWEIVKNFTQTCVFNKRERVSSLRKLLAPLVFVVIGYWIFWRKKLFSAEPV